VIRALSTDDLPAAVALLEIAGLGGAKANLGRYLRCQPRCGWAAIEHGALVGLVTVLQQGRVGFVGAMAVHPDHRGAGVGRALLDHAHADARRAGIATFLLEATPLGEHLYRRLGYVPEHDTLILQRDAAVASVATRIAPTDHAAITTLDRIATGAVRDDMLADLLAEHGPGTTIHVHREAVGVGLVIGDRLGPVLATHVGVGRALVDQLAPACRVVTIPEPNQAALAAVAIHGFREVRRLRRMRLGPAVPVRTDWIWALASPGAG
jgi:GNAT superfamily N-acetyltransferase